MDTKSTVLQKKEALQAALEIVIACKPLESPEAMLETVYKKIITLAKEDGFSTW